MGRARIMGRRTVSRDRGLALGLELRRGLGLLGVGARVRLRGVQSRRRFRVVIPLI